jgi:hypothetical protein
MAKGEGFEVGHFVDNYPWDSVGEGTVVDVSIGHPIRHKFQKVSFQKTAKLTLIDGWSRGLCLSCNCHQVPKLKFIVQDLPSMVTPEAIAAVPAELKSWVSFQVRRAACDEPVRIQRFTALS